jgi:ABC-type antimicrobial peptide transport system permease subunit
MKTVIKVLVGIFLGLGLFQLVDLSLYLMNQSDTYLFNIGIVLFGIIFVAFGYLGLYLMKIIKPEKEEVKQKNEL